MRNILMGLVVMSGTCAVGARAQDTLGVADLENIANQVRDFRPKDQFDLPPNPPSVAGKRFTYTVKPSQSAPYDRVCEGYPSWSFDAGKQVYQAWPGLSSFDPDHFKPKYGPLVHFDMVTKFETALVNYHSFACTMTDRPSYTASNAYGAKVEVQVRKAKVTAIGFAEGAINFEAMWDRPYWWDKITSGDEARGLANNLLVRLSGTLSQWPDGRTVICGVDPGPGTSFSYPYEESTDICVFYGRADKIEYVDEQTGQVLYSTSAKSYKSRVRSGAATMQK